MRVLFFLYKFILGAGDVIRACGAVRASLLELKAETLNSTSRARARSMLKLLSADYNLTVLNPLQHPQVRFALHATKTFPGPLNISPDYRLPRPKYTTAYPRSARSANHRPSKLALAI